MLVLRDFYVATVGLVVGPRPPSPIFGYWLYAADLDVLHLAEQEPDDQRRIGSDLTFDHVAFECHDWPEYETRLAIAGVEYYKEHVPISHRLQVFFRDPAGNGIELLFPPGSHATTSHRNRT